MITSLMLLASFLFGSYTAYKTAILEDKVDTLVNMEVKPGAIAGEYADMVFRLNYSENYDDFLGTGFTVKYRNKVLLLTAGHVCQGQKEVYIFDSDFSTKDAPRKSKKLKVYGDHDLCLVGGMPDSTPAFDLAHGTDMNETYYALGFPGGLPMALTYGNLLGADRISMPLGSVSEMTLCEGEALKIIQTKEHNICLMYGMFIQTSIPVMSGSSGSPVFNATGEVIGVVSYMSEESPGHWAGLVPLRNVVRFLDSLK